MNSDFKDLLAILDQEEIRYLARCFALECKNAGLSLDLADIAELESIAPDDNKA